MRFFASLCFAGCGALLALAVQTPSIDSFAQGNLRDASFTARVVTGNQRELAKINKDFANSYRFKFMTTWIAEPFKLRLESNVDDTKIFFIINGTTRLVRVPRSNINIRENLADSPGKRQTVFDFGLVTPSLLSDLLDAKFVRMDRTSNQPVFDITYKKKFDDTTRHRVWMDPNRKFVTRREWYSQVDNRLLATFSYEEPQQVAGVWIPTKVTVRNAENKVAGVTEYTAIKVNQGLSPSLFEIK